MIIRGRLLFFMVSKVFLALLKRWVLMLVNLKFCLMVIWILFLLLIKNILYIWCFCDYCGFVICGNDMEKWVFESVDFVMFNLLFIFCIICCEIERLSFSLFFLVVKNGLKRWLIFFCEIFGLLLLIWIVM